MTGIPVAPGELVDIGYLNEVARTHYRKTTAKQVVNSIVETDLLNGEITIGAGALGASRAVRLTAWGDWLNFSGATQASPRFKIKLGATTLLDSNVIAGVWGSVNTRDPWRFVVEIANLGAANSQLSSIDGRLVIASAPLANFAYFTTGEGTVSIPSVAISSVPLFVLGQNTTAVDTTSAQALALTVTLPAANASLDVTLKGALVEIV
jgi:hypothetical protein